ncbi:MAG: hypothetical protein AB1742_14390 [bacterium]
MNHRKAERGAPARKGVHPARVAAFAAAAALLISSAAPCGGETPPTGEIIKKINERLDAVESYSVAFSLYKPPPGGKVNKTRKEILTEKYRVAWKRGPEDGGDYMRLTGLKGNNRGTEVFFRPGGRVAVVREGRTMRVGRSDPRLRNFFGADYLRLAGSAAEDLADANDAAAVRADGGDFVITTVGVEDVVTPAKEKRGEVATRRTFTFNGGFVMTGLVVEEKVVMYPGLSDEIKKSLYGMFGREYRRRKPRFRLKAEIKWYEIELDAGLSAEDFVPGKR